MFEVARWKLTAWYLLIIMIVSLLFSAAFYNSSTREIQRIIDRVQFDQRREFAPGMRVLFAQPARSAPSLDELELLKKRSFMGLIIVNGVILVFAGAAGYFLAGQTLKPIQEMVNEQSTFISNASHELRTPLATLRAQLEGSLLEKRLSDPKARQLIHSNLEEVFALQSLTDHLLQAAQSDVLETETAKEQLSLVEIVTSAQKKVSTLAAAKNITFKVKIQDAVITGSSAQLTEAVIILLDNAIKYSPENSRIVITSRLKSSVVELAIIDKGRGISPRDLPHIFERFYRADAARSQKEGYGLGLSIAKKIIESHDGQIGVTSTFGQGSSFIVTLPLS